MKPAVGLALTCVAATVVAAQRPVPTSGFQAGAGAMAILSVAATDTCGATAGARVSAAGVWVDGRYDHELLLFPGSGRDRYDTLLGPFEAGRHEVELRPSSFWSPAPCVQPGRTDVTVVDTGSPRHVLLGHAPVLELRADTVGEQTDVPLYEYVERESANGDDLLRYTVVFSHEDGGTQTRALLARWGRTTDIEQIYEASIRGGRAIREEFQGPDHETRAFNGRRRGAAPILLVATLNNMVTDRGRGIAAVRPVPEPADLSRATRESTLDGRPWAFRVMQQELEAEGRIAADAPVDDRWLRVAPDPREHAYLEARLTLDRAVAAAWVRDRDGHRFWSHYQRDTLAINRNGWVRTAVAIGLGRGSGIAEVGWACIPTPGEQGTGTCVIEATRAFVFAEGWVPGQNLVVPATLTLTAGQDGRLRAAGLR